MTNLEEMLSRLDASQDEAERLIGADWLEEQGYIQEASFYRWLVTSKLEPDFWHNYYAWYNPQLKDYSFFFVLWTITHSVIPSYRVWANLFNNNSDYSRKTFHKRNTAIRQLRLAYLKAIKLYGSLDNALPAG